MARGGRGRGGPIPSRPVFDPRPGRSSDWSSDHREWDGLRDFRRPGRPGRASTPIRPASPIRPRRGRAVPGRSSPNADGSNRCSRGTEGAGSARCAGDGRNPRKRPVCLRNRTIRRHERSELFRPPSSIPDRSAGRQCVARIGVAERRQDEHEDDVDRTDHGGVSGLGDRVRASCCEPLRGDRRFCMVASIASARAGGCCASCSAGPHAPRSF